MITSSISLLLLPIHCLSFYQLYLFIQPPSSYFLLTVSSAEQFLDELILMCCVPTEDPNKPYPTRYLMGYYLVFLICVVIIGGIADALSNDPEHHNLKNDPGI